LPLRDGNERDQPENLCVDVVDSLPRCMAMIEPTEVIGRIELYFKGGALRFLSGPQAAFARKAVARTEINLTDRQPLGIHTAPLALGAFLNNLSPYPRTFSGRGIVISAQKPRSLEKARRMARRLGHLKCSLPIEIWYSTPPAMNGKACVYSYQIDHLSGLQPKPAPQGHTNCSGLKLYALRHCPFQQVLLLDAETVPLRSPESLFESAEFSETGAVFWPDSGVLGRERFLWRLCDIRFDKHEPELEGGQGLIDKERCWDVLQVAGWLNEHADFFYRYIRSEYEILHLAFRKIGKPFSMPSKAARISNGSKIQYGFQGHRSFLRRTTFERARRQAGGRSNYEWLRSLGWHQ